MTRRSPLLRACMALRLPRGLYCLRGDLHLSDAEIRANLRRVRLYTAELAEALAETLANLDRHAEPDPWAVIAAAESAITRRAAVGQAELAPSMLGVVTALAMTARAEDGDIAPEDWAALNEVMP